MEHAQREDEWPGLVEALGVLILILMEHAQREGIGSSGNPEYFKLS